MGHKFRKEFTFFANTSLVLTETWQTEKFGIPHAKFVSDAADGAHYHAELLALFTLTHEEIK